MPELCTYFVRDGAGRVKIGTSSRDVESQRIKKELQVGNADVLQLAGLISGDVEEEVRLRFAADKVRGEWFSESAALAGFIDAYTVPPTQEATTMNTEIKTIPVDKLHIDKRYQRGLDTGRVCRMASVWSADLCGVITVNQRDNGDYYVPDGQHRVAAAKQANIYALRAEVHLNKTPEQEAVLFDQLNASRSGVTAIDMFRSRLFWGDERAIKIDKAVSDLGGKIRTNWAGEGSNEADIPGVVALERAYNRAGDAAFRHVLGVIRDGFGGLSSSTCHSVVVGGVLEFFIRHGWDAKQRARVVEKLNKNGIGKLNEDLNRYKGLGAGADMACYMAILGFYNHKMHNKLVVNPGKFSKRQIGESVAALEKKPDKGAAV